MRVLYKKPIFLEEVETKSGAVLKRIVINETHFFLEQNPRKESKYGRMYREIKAKNPEFYMFWEIKNNEFTGEVLVGEIVNSENLEDLFKK